ncbi:MAG: hypothetical protein ACFNKJ_07150 [Rothia dentocariosa]|nr:hypothetical protein [Rothia sp. HMSC065D02]
MIVKIPSTADAGAAMRIHLVIAAIIEDNSRERDFIVGNIRVGTDLIRVLYIFVGDTIVSTPQDARQHQQMRKRTNMKTREPLKHARRVYKKPAQVTLQGA